MIYISGSITKDPIGSKVKFKTMEDKLTALGKVAVNPRNHDLPEGLDIHKDSDKIWNIMMKKSLIDMLLCDEIVMLEGWEESRGAVIEYMLSKHLGYIIYNHKLEKMI